MDLDTGHRTVAQQPAELSRCLLADIARVIGRAFGQGACLLICWSGVDLLGVALLAGAVCIGEDCVGMVRAEYPLAVVKELFECNRDTGRDTGLALPAGNAEPGAQGVGVVGAEYA